MTVDSLTKIEFLGHPLGREVLPIIALVLRGAGVLGFRVWAWCCVVEHFQQRLLKERFHSPQVWVCGHRHGKGPGTRPWPARFCSSSCWCSLSPISYAFMLPRCLNDKLCSRASALRRKLSAHPSERKKDHPNSGVSGLGFRN